MQEAPVTVECLRCGHVGTLDAEALRAAGQKPDAPIAGFAKRLRCTKCGSRAIKATRG